MFDVGFDKSSKTLFWSFTESGDELLLNGWKIRVEPIGPQIHATVRH